ncbi:ferrochelatase [Pseudogymnoascus sp. 24MN13]|nr:ferrochelatase [Pseudogymnoascus sp. 24MN13]
MALRTATRQLSRHASPATLSLTAARRQTRGLATPAATAPPTTPSKGPTAIVFMNMGGPSTVPEVGDFLSRLFADADLIPLGRFQKYLGPLIAQRRTPKIEKQYAAIGGGSPIRKWSELQAAEMCKILDQRARRRRRISLTLNDLWKWREKLEGTGRGGEVKANGEDGSIQWSVIDRWPAHKGLVEAFAQNIEATLAKYSEADRKDVTILFSAHSLPMTVVNRGDPYPAEVAETVYVGMSVGPQPWLGAQTSDTVTNYVANGKKNLVLVPIAFTSDHIETLYEVDEELIGESGCKDSIRRVESLNGSPVFIQALADIAKAHLEGGVQCSKQMALRCPGCTNAKCEASKDFFASGPGGAVEA